jgi:hypothetical protein
METIICDIARNRIERDINDAFNDLGLSVKSIRFEESERLSVVIELTSTDGALVFCAS